MAEVIRGGRWAPGAGPPERAQSNLLVGPSQEDSRSLLGDDAEQIMALVLQKSSIGVAVFHEKEFELLWAQ